MAVGVAVSGLFRKAHLVRDWVAHVFRVAVVCREDVVSGAGQKTVHLRNDAFHSAAGRAGDIGIEKEYFHCFDLGCQLYGSFLLPVILFIAACSMKTSRGISMNPNLSRQRART